MKFGPYCGALGCHNDAAVEIEHPKHGKLVTCRECAASHEVVGHV